MKKILFILAFILLSASLFSQSGNKDIEIRKASPTLKLNGTSAVINFYNGDITLTQSSNTLTLGGGNFALGSNSMTMTGSLAATGSRVLKGWFTDLEISSLPTIGGVAIHTNPTFTTPSLGVATATSIDASGVLESGANGGTNGQLKLFGSTSGDATIKTAAAAGASTIFQLPATNGTNNYILKTDGSGVTSWTENTGGSVTAAFIDTIRNSQSGVYNVLDYGATGDGSTDDATY